MYVHEKSHILSLIIASCNLIKIENYEKTKKESGIKNS
jgi:hypothetical protein